jgi:hypothetical protein
MRARKSACHKSFQTMMDRLMDLLAMPFNIGINTSISPNKYIEKCLHAFIDLSHTMALVMNTQFRFAFSGFT